jgi:hypothetical protein
MSLQYDSLHDGIVALGESQEHYAEAVQRLVESVEERFATEERLYAELRDDLHALANRLEALTRAAS